MNDIEKEIHSNAREARARQCFNAVQKQKRPDIAIAIILQAIDDWYEKGLLLGKHKKMTHNIELMGERMDDYEKVTNLVRKRIAARKLKNAEASESASTSCCVAGPGDIVTLKDHTDYYRVYTLNSVKIYCGLNSDTVRTENDIEVGSIIEKAT